MLRVEQGPCVRAAPAPAAAAAAWQPGLQLMEVPAPPRPLDDALQAAGQHVWRLDGTAQSKLTNVCALGGELGGPRGVLGSAAGRAC